MTTPPEQPPSPRVFVLAIVNALGLDESQKTAIAKALDLPEPHHATKRVTRWLESDAGPNYGGMMTMLMKAGWLTDDAWGHLRDAEEQARQAEEKARRLEPGPPSPKRRANG